MVNPFMSQILRSIQRFTGNLAQQLPLSKKIKPSTFDPTSNRDYITKISSKEPDLESSSTEPIIIKEG